MKHSREPKWQKEIIDRQQNTTYPQVLRNAALIDAFILRGSSKATVLQRIGIAVIGLYFLACAVMISLAIWSQSGARCFKALMLLSALPFLVFGVKLLRNAFRKN